MSNYMETTSYEEAFEALENCKKVEMDDTGIQLRIKFGHLCLPTDHYLDYKHGRVFRIYEPEPEPKPRGLVRHGTENIVGTIYADEIEVSEWIGRKNCAGFEFKEQPGRLFPNPIGYGPYGDFWSSARVEDLKSGSVKQATLAAVWAWEFTE